MAVEWVGTASGQKNNFGSKHIVHVEEVPTDWESVKVVAGLVWRLRNNKAPHLIAGAMKKQTFGTIKPSASTIIITTEAAQTAMEAWVDANVGGTRKNVLLPVSEGIVATYDSVAGATTILMPDPGSSLVVDVDVTVTGGVRSVYHLNGARIT
jgi:hypothetical protein